jgi:hypothetical protein
MVYCIAVMGFLFATASGFCASEPNQGPWLRYESEGGFSPYEKVIIGIHAEGKTSVEVKKKQASSYTYMITLSAEEMASLQTLIRAVDFFSQPDRDTALTIDADTTLLSIRMADKSKELIFRYRPALEPLVSYMQRLIVQAEAIQDIMQGGNAYRLLNAVSSQLSGAKALQPREFVLPLKLYISTSDNARNLEWAIEGLSWVASPEEWSGFLAMTLAGADKNRQDLLMSILTSNPFGGNIPTPHLQAMCPLLLIYLIDNQAGYRLMSENQRRSIQGAFSVIGDNHYWPALPFLASIFDAQDQPEITTEISVITRMGKRGVSLLSSCLDNTSANKRRNAVELIGRAYHSHRYGQELKPVDDYEYSLMVKLYSDRIGEQLRTLAQKDPSQNVRSLAEKTFQDTQAEIEAWKSRTKEIGI